MTIDYSFTDRNSVRIACGDDTIEVGVRADGRLEVVQLSMATSPATAPTPTPAPAPPPTGLPTTPIRLKRPTYPRTSFVVVNGEVQGVDDDVFVQEGEPSSMVGLSQLVLPSVGQIDLIITQHARTIGQTRILDVHDDAKPSDRAAGLSNLTRLVDDPGIALDAVRLWKP